MRNKFIKHKLYKDVCFRVLYCVAKEYKTEFKIEWWNLGYVNSYCMGLRQFIDISYDDYSNWLYTTDMVNCLRDANWQKLR